MLTGEIADALSARIEGDRTIDISRLVHPARAECASDLAIAMSREAAAALAGSKEQAPAGFKAIIGVTEPRMALAKLTALFDQKSRVAEGVDRTAVIAPDAVLGEGVCVGPFVVIGARSRIGAGTRILPHVTIGSDVSIGADCLIHPGVRIGHDVKIGTRVIIHSNAVIGADGFSYAPDLNSPIAFTAGLEIRRIHSLGNVVLGDDVEIGACTAI